ncbi:bifunctional adenosylcobinamide kinase/adenosylcobinamide-phosphate guanylyltransferase [bacterium]|nr:bifunctional adenosylcobinamide kinase/adenosylcobinamide-phosphate guanylyltransferase [bacterium]
MITLILGGARSGKSSYAEEMALKFGSSPDERCYLAAGVSCDKEMEKRIALHRQRREGKFYTAEEPYDLAKALLQLDSKTKVVLIDCLTTWLGNLSYRASQHGQDEAEVYRRCGDSLEVFPEMSSLCRALPEIQAEVILISNELGLGLVPADPSSRLFRDRHGRMNQRMAALADRVIFIAAGLPMQLKG